MLFESLIFFMFRGLIPAVKAMFPEAEHRFCVRHLYANFNEKYKGEILKKQLWACARSSSVQQWNRKDESFECGCLQMARKDAS